MSSERMEVSSDASDRAELKGDMEGFGDLNVTGDDGREFGVGGSV